LTVDKSVDVFVVGLGAMGSATLWQLARRGVRVTGADRFRPPHSLGSSHGRSRIIRKAYFEHPDYVPIVLRAYELWRALEEASGRTLLVETGGLMIGPEDGAVVTGSLTSARRHGLRHEVLSAKEVERRFPAFRLAPDECAVYEPDAGVVMPEDAIAALLAEAERHGAEVWLETDVGALEPAADGVLVHTARGPVRARRAVLAVGAWAPTFLGERVPLSVERQVMHWFRGLGEAFAHPNLPVFIRDRGAEVAVYGLPDMGEGFKVAIHHGGATTTADAVDRQVHAADVDRLLDLAGDILPRLAGRRPDESAVCLYTNTPDLHFVLGPHPDLAGVVVAAGFSGHGFKFTPAMGEILAALALDERPPFAIDLFSPARFATT
jgi:sarcosine oxidase